MINGASGQLMAAPEIDTSPPSGPPTNLSSYKWSGNKVGVQWTNGDATAMTQVYVSMTLDVDPDGPHLITKPAGATSYDSQIDSGTWNFWYVRHLKNGQYSTWEWVEDPDGTGDL